jgi:hypothetical protein
MCVHEVLAARDGVLEYFLTFVAETSRPGTRSVVQLGPNFAGRGFLCGLTLSCLHTVARVLQSNNHDQQDQWYEPCYWCLSPTWAFVLSGRCGV